MGEVRKIFPNENEFPIIDVPINHSMFHTLFDVKKIPQNQLPDRIKTALAKNVNPSSVDANAAAIAFQLDETMRNRLQKLFQRNDELRYSGTSNGKEGISPDSRREVLELIDQLRV